MKETEEEVSRRLRVDGWQCCGDAAGNVPNIQRAIDSFEAQKFRIV